MSWCSIMAELKLTCDSCGTEYVLDPVGIKETSIALDEGLCRVLWFNCPEPSCKRVYLVAVCDAKLAELKRDLDKQVKRQRMMHGRENPQLAKVIAEMIEKKKARLSKHVDNLKRKYDGRFTLVTTENGTEDLQFLP